MNTESVDLIATDPPFNKGRDFHTNPDNLETGASFQDRWTWQDDVHDEWVDQMQDDHPRLYEVISMARRAHSDAMGAFLCFMSVRLLEMHRILKSTGSLYLHCDHTASHYLKMTMDAIFGIKNFQNEIVWGYKTSGRTKKRFNRKHDIILFYSKNINKAGFNVLRNKLSEKELRRFNKEDEGGKFYIDGKGYKYYLDEAAPSLNDWWTDIDALNSRANERKLFKCPKTGKWKGYPTQKPVALYRRIIAASSNQDDIVLDPFCGCATTLAAAESMTDEKGVPQRRQWVGIDLWDKAHETVMRRIGIECEGFDGGLVTLETEPPMRTDGGETASPEKITPIRVQDKPTLSKQQMKETLLRSNAKLICPGCYHTMPHEGFFELDHDKPRSLGGSNDIENRTLLCSPCNRIKSNRMTLDELRKENKKRGYMAATDIKDGFHR